MLIVSFSWTSGALEAKRKRCTRRSWSEEYAARFHAGQLVQAWNQGPRVGGHKVGEIRLMADPYPEPTSRMTELDFEAEGLKWMEEQKVLIRNKTPRQFFEDWKAQDEVVYVVRFQLVSLVTPKPSVNKML